MCVVSEPAYVWSQILLFILIMNYCWQVQYLGWIEISFYHVNIMASLLCIVTLCPLVQRSACLCLIYSREPFPQKKIVAYETLFCSKSPVSSDIIQGSLTTQDQLQILGSRFFELESYDVKGKAKLTVIWMWKFFPFSKFYINWKYVTWSPKFRKTKNMFFLLLLFFISDEYAKCAGYSDKFQNTGPPEAKLYNSLLYIHMTYLPIFDMQIYQVTCLLLH